MGQWQNMISWLRQEFQEPQQWKKSTYMDDTFPCISHVPADRMFLTDHCDSQPESEKGFVGDKNKSKMYHD
jgi:hypothetical protein